MHHAKDSDFYSDRALAQAIFTLLTPEAAGETPLPKSSDYEVNSKYFHPLCQLHCRSVTGE